MRHAFTVVAVLALAAACASPGLPPGGPTISAFPRVIATLPDSNAVNVRPGKVLVRYDDVISEQAGGGPLSRIVLISPWDGEPKVDWRRTGMSIAPRIGWRQNTAYTITILPGVGDLKGQPSPYGYVLRFSTGATIPTSTLRGVAFDWVAGKALPKATIQAIDVRDTTLVHVTVADSTGRYELGAMPSGTYLVRAIDEKSPNRTLDQREPWDTSTVVLADSARADLYVFVHDTIPLRISEIRSTDSVTIALTFDKPMLPGVAVPVSAIRVQKADSTVIAVQSVQTAAEERAQKAREDSIARAADTTARRPATDTAPRRTIDPTTGSRHHLSRDGGWGVQPDGSRRLGDPPPDHPEGGARGYHGAPARYTARHEHAAGSAGHETGRHATTAWPPLMHDSRSPESA